MPKRSNAWIKHVKEYQAEHGCSYGEALKGAKATYRGGAVRQMRPLRTRIGVVVKPKATGGRRRKARKTRGGDLAGTLGNLISIGSKILPMLL